MTIIIFVQVEALRKFQGQFRFFKWNFMNFFTQYDSSNYSA